MAQQEPEQNEISYRKRVREFMAQEGRKRPGSLATQRVDSPPAELPRSQRVKSGQGLTLGQKLGLRPAPLKPKSTVPIKNPQIAVAKAAAEQQAVGPIDPDDVTFDITPTAPKPTPIKRQPAGPMPSTLAGGGEVSVMPSQPQPRNYDPFA